MTDFDREALEIADTMPMMPETGKEIEEWWCDFARRLRDKWQARMEPHVDADLDAGWLPFPSKLHPDTRELVLQFAWRLAIKLRKAEQKYGYSNGWKTEDWMDECRAKLREHVEKGDPLDVAAYCAFLHWHRESTVAALPQPEQNAAEQENKAGTASESGAAVQAPSSTSRSLPNNPAPAAPGVVPMEPTEDQIIAGAHVIASSPLIDSPRLGWESWLGLSRAVLCGRPLPQPESNAALNLKGGDCHESAENITGHNAVAGGRASEQRDRCARRGGG